MAIARRIAGIAISPSMTRISTASSTRKKPDNRPSGRPIRTATKAAPSPTMSEVRAP